MKSTRITGATKGMLSAATVALLVGAMACATAKSSRETVGGASARKLAQHGDALIRSDYAEGELTRLCQAAIDEAKRRFDAVASVPADARTIDNTLLALEAAFADYSDAITPLTFMGYVSTHEKIAAEGSACEEKQGKFDVETSSRKDLYEAIRGARGRNDEEKRLVSETIRSFELNGLKLPDEKLAQVRELKTQLAALEAQFASNLNKDATTVEFDAAELEGVSAEFLARLAKGASGKYVVTTKSTDYDQVMERAKLGETRRKMLLAYVNRAAAANVPLLEQAIVLRGRIAAEMGFATWADYRTQNRMAKSGATALEFLNGLKAKLAQRNRADLAKLLAFMKESDPSATELKLWDIGYASYQLKKRDFSLDDEKIREFFPAETVIRGMFDVYSRLLGVRYVEVSEAEGGKAWAPGVKLYRIENAADGELIAYFFADFFPRPGKYGHAAAFTLIQGRRLADGAYSKPISSIVSNMNPPSADKPSLLNHREVETLFHEFGHIMHQTLTRAPYASLAGSSTARDFVEAPSQMLENWVWSPEVLTSLSGHYQDPSQKLPPEVLRKMIAARDFNQGYFYTRQLMLGLLDMTYHTASGPVDSTTVVDRLYREIIGVEPIAGGRFQAGFGHLMGGYDAGYYGYLWSKVYAEDMFTRFERDGLLSPEVGMRYRKEILERGNMRDAMDLLRAFLGREPDNQAFLRKLGIGAGGKKKGKKHGRG